MTTVRQPTKRRHFCVLILKYTFICVYWWTRQRIHNTLIMVDRYLRLMGDKTIPDSAEPRLESFYPPFVAGINLPHQSVVDSYNLHNGNSYTVKTAFLYRISPYDIDGSNVSCVSLVPCRIPPLQRGIKIKLVLIFVSNRVLQISNHRIIALYKIVKKFIWWSDISKSHSSITSALSLD